MTDYPTGALTSLDHPKNKTTDGDTATALLDYGGAICVCKTVDCPKVLTVTTDKCCLKLNAVEATNTAGNTDGKIVTPTDDTTDIVGITIPVVNVSTENGVLEAHVRRIYLASLGFVTERTENLITKEPAAINLTISLEEKKIDKTAESLAVLSTGEVTT